MTNSEVACVSELFSIEISLTKQMLTVFKSGDEIVSYSVSSGKAGAGELDGSGCTPRGRHVIRAKIGEDQPEYSVYVGRRTTGEIYNKDLAERFPERDWILTRILWLSGLEPGKNRLKNSAGVRVDTMRRYIYIHGTPDSEPMGVAASHGCIRMRNKDVLELFDTVPVGTSVNIIE